MFFNNLVYRIPNEFKKKDQLKEFILKHSEIKFVSLFGIDFLGNDTDEHIPVEYFLKNLEEIFQGGIQTDGSSVNLPGIADLSDAKIDFIIDFESNWYVDYNYDFLCENLPVGTMRIPAFFKHNNNFYCSRSVLKNTLDYMKDEMKKIVSSDKNFLKKHKIKKTDIKDIYFTLGTELEFWVRTPANQISVDELAVTQSLKESYWKRTKGQVRTALEESLLILQAYGLEPEMGHKEVGGVKGKINTSGNLYDVMEQLEIDWKYSEPLQNADNELLARIIVKEVFRRNGLEVTFDAKPVEAVAGSGEHMHVGMGLILKNGKKINLFASYDEELFLSNIGYGAIMGLLKNWESVNPFVTHSIDALKRLKPGFEAPVSVVTSLGKSPKEPSRNRTVLAGLIRSDNPLSVRFEVRAANPHTNTYLATSAIYLAMLDGIRYAIGKDVRTLHNELTKKYGEETAYLEKMREYRSEKDIFEDYSAEERENLFGKAPSTVWEILKNARKHEKIFDNTPFSDDIRNSFFQTALNKWLIELKEKEIQKIRSEIKNMRKYNGFDNSYDKELLDKIDAMIRLIAKNDKNSYSLIKKIENAIIDKDYDTVSELSKELFDKFSKLKALHKEYLENII